MLPCSTFSWPCQANKVTMMQPSLTILPSLVVIDEKESNVKLEYHNFAYKMASN